MTERPVALPPDNPEARAVPEYRIFEFDNAGQILGRPKIVTYENDQGAIAETRKWLNDAPLEIWEGTRRVATITFERRNAARLGRLS